MSVTNENEADTAQCPHGIREPVICPQCDPAA